MRSLKQLNLSEKEKDALRELKKKLSKIFPNIEIIIFGSKARGDFEPESDIDLLILIDNEVDTTIEEKINEVIYDIELKYNVVFGKIIESKKFWNSPHHIITPIHKYIEKEGIVI
ncbi:nucleotidyltransferase domain-containing protein [Candidatus Aminicenantes bacterium AC-708-M15]|jgi:predicted nucleotidyltransferase|nr:nucleotidyltransferase domain-containing protein [SCandidatus Aminicenantes bacterium Aminicenantia_JdfR_composite]MCP2596503.1 nucleotidyltransferase domain-containing protein [Candidatus Aminicenantes bacterium AC-335-G13]MCP2603900.1 nucleotidyltransferase domain-containing protein [Candidatus Aminicenantes bacterium AC-708-M15]MCP2605712.1 nucleotidyltransferase domain-containing protein [Candidatus Aminicenantes bacterium AC-335-O07]MCP2618097.1 nucleotidyltransferase domain-containing 